MFPSIAAMNGGAAMFDIVLVGADDSRTARRAVEAAVNLAEISKGQLHIVSAFERHPHLDTSLPDEFKNLRDEGGIDALLQSLSFIATERGIEPVLHAGRGDPADVIIKKAEEVHADVVVVGNRGMKGVRRVLGSVPNTVAHHAHCSIMVVDTTEEP